MPELATSLAIGLLTGMVVGLWTLSLLVKKVKERHPELRAVLVVDVIYGLAALLALSSIVLVHSVRYQRTEREAQLMMMQGEEEVYPVGPPGEMKVEYPLLMSPGATDNVIVSIYMLPELASLDPVKIERVEIPLDAPQVLGRLNSHKVVIQVAERMRVELVGEAFNPVAHYPSVQSVDIHQFEKAAVWAWSITAPAVLGHHSLTIRVYQEPRETPSYVGLCQIDVANFTPTPLPSGTPIPMVTPPPVSPEIENQLAKNTGLIVAALIGLLGSLVISYLAIRLREGKAAVAAADADELAYDIAAVRKLLLEAFTTEELRRFCLDRPTFRPIVNQFSHSHGLDDMVDEVIDYCRKHHQWDELLSEVAKENPRQYIRFGPYSLNTQTGQCDGEKRVGDASPEPDPSEPKRQDVEETSDQQGDLHV